MLSNMAAANNTNTLSCCVPMTGVCNMQPIHRTTLLTMVKVDCSTSNCTESGFIHPECFDKLEQMLIRYVTNYQWDNSHKQENMRTYNWSSGPVREKLWKHWIYNNLISKHKQLNCNCGNGYLRKDLSWPPTNWRKSYKKPKAKECPTLPQLNHTGGKVRYMPSVTPDYTISGPSVAIPGAVFVEKGRVVKKGVIMTWSGGVGQIRNLENKEERLCVAKDEVVNGVERDFERMVGSEVEYKTEKRGKRLEAVMVKLVKIVEWRKGMVTHWVPEELAGVIMMEKEEVIVYRREFVPGGFAPNIVGKIVQFKLDKCRQEATCVKVEQQMEELQHVEERAKTRIGNIVTQFSDLDLVECPLLGQAVSSESSLVMDMSSMSTRHKIVLLDQLEKFLPTLAAHPVGYKVVVEMMRQLQDNLLDRLVRILSREFFNLSQAPAGAMCLLDSLTILSMELQHSLVIHAYSHLSNLQQAVDHLTGLNSSLVFKFCLPLLNISMLRQLVLLLSPALACLANHKSLRLLV